LHEIPFNIHDLRSLSQTWAFQTAKWQVKARLSDSSL
jgi:hypothetical protein